MKIPQAVWVIGGLALAYYIIRKGVGSVSAAVSDVGTAVGKTVQLFTRDGPVKVNAKIILPGAQAIDPAKVALTKTPNKDEFTFAYAGMRYRLLPRNSEGNYPAAVL